MSSSKEIQLFKELHKKAMRDEHCIGMLVHGMQEFLEHVHVVDSFSLARSLADLGEEFRTNLALIDPRIDDMPSCSVCNNRWGGFSVTGPKGMLPQKLIDTLNKMCGEG